MVVFVIGANHKTASMKTLETYFLSEDKSAGFYDHMSIKGFYFEMVPMQTCNRVELYFAADRSEIIIDMFKSFFKVSSSDFSSHFYCLHGNECIQHLMEVVSSLDSVILGESQILGQVRDSYLKAKEIGYTSKVLNRLFEQTVKTGKRVRTETGISKGAVSISQAAVELGRKVFRSLESAELILLGAGEMGRLTLDHLTTTKVSKVTVLNRTFDRANKLIQRYDERMTCANLEMLESLILEVDMIFGAMNFDGYILTRDYLDSLMPRRRYKPLFLIDISLPRVLDPDCNKIDNVFHYGIEDLKDVVDKNKQERELQAQLAHQIIKQEVLDLEFWLSLYKLAPLMQSMNDYKKFLIEQHNRKFSGFINDIFRDIDKESQMSSQLKNEIIDKLNNFSQKSAHQLGGKLNHLITQLAKNYPQNPIDQQRLQKVIKEVLKATESNTDFDSKLSSGFVDESLYLSDS
ncbi:MAG: glutamyl-tRNA reductase [bacterium]|nr:glutamyl-tRNA reductase [bacterium]